MRVATWHAQKMAREPPPLQGVTSEQQHELRSMLLRLSALWAELTAAAAREDHGRLAAIQREIAACRARVEAIKRSGTGGAA